MSLLEISLLCVVVIAGGYAGVKFLLKKDTAREERRRGAAQLALTLSGIGLKKTPEFLVSYSVGDYSGMAQNIKELVSTFATGEVAVLAEFSKVFDGLLDAKLGTESGRSFIAAKLSDAVQERDVSVVQDAPIAGVVQKVKDLVSKDLSLTRAITP